MLEVLENDLQEPDRDGHGTPDLRGFGPLASRIGQIDERPKSVVRAIRRNEFHGAWQS